MIHRGCIFWDGRLDSGCLFAGRHSLSYWLSSDSKFPCCTHSVVHMYLRRFGSCCTPVFLFSLISFLFLFFCFLFCFFCYLFSFLCLPSFLASFGSLSSFHFWFNSKFLANAKGWPNSFALILRPPPNVQQDR